MLKKIVSMVLAITIAIAVIPLSAFATINKEIASLLEGYIKEFYGINTNVTQADIADYLTIAYIAAADETYEAIKMEDLQLNIGDDISTFTLCPLFANDKISFNHAIYTTFLEYHKGGWSYDMDNILNGESNIGPAFKSSCESKYIISANVKDDIAGFDNQAENSDYTWYLHGTIGVSHKSNSVEFDGFNNVKIPIIYPIYAWANIDNIYTGSNCTDFNRLYRIVTTPHADDKCVNVVDYAVSGYHLLLYVFMLHDILSNPATVDKVIEYYNSNSNVVNSIASLNNSDIQKMLNNVRTYMETCVTRDRFNDKADDLLYRALTIAATQGDTQHATVGIDDRLVQAVDILYDPLVNNTNSDSDYIQCRFPCVCIDSATIMACMLGNDLRDRKTVAKFGYMVWGGEIPTDLQNNLKELTNLLETNEAAGSGLGKTLDAYRELIELSGGGTAAKYTNSIFKSLFGNANPWALNSNWLNNVDQKTYWTYDNFTRVLENFCNWSSNWGTISVSELKITGEKFDILNECWGLTEGKTQDVSGGGIIYGSTYTILTYLQSIKQVYQGIKNNADTYLKAIEIKQSSITTLSSLKEMGVHNNLGIWLYLAALTEDSSIIDGIIADVKKAEDNVLQALQAQNGPTAQISRNSLQKANLRSCTIKLLDALSSKEVVPLLSTELRDIVNVTNKLDDSWHNHWRESGLAKNPETGYITNIDNLLEEYCMKDTELSIRYTHYISLHNKTNNKNVKLANSSEASTTNPLIQSEIDRLSAQYKGALATSGDDDITIFSQLLAMSDVLDLYAEYGIALPESDTTNTQLISKVINTLNNYYDKYFKKEKIIGSRTSYYAGSYTLPHSLNVYPYQLILADMLVIKGGYIYTALLNDIILNGGTNLTKMQEYINAVDIIHTLVNKYPNSTTYSLWYHTNKEKMGDIEEDSSGQAPSTYADLYGYLVHMGLVDSDEYLSDIYNANNPLSIFFTANGGYDITFSKEYYKGRSLSATFLPMQTNTYDPYVYLNYLDTDWIEKFQYNYGFHRKALMIDTNVDAAVDNYVSNTSGNTRVATLKDLFNPESDIVLYVDDNYYNLQSLAEQQDKVYDRIASLDNNPLNNLLKGISNFFTDMFEVRFEVALKQDEYDTYSDRIKENVSDLSYKSGSESGKTYDDYILDTPTARKYLDKPNRYTEMMGFAFVSLMYRDNNSYNAIRSGVLDHKPVFISSPTLATVQGVGDQQRGSIYNYALLKNLPAMCSVGANQSLDMTSPIFIDIYGNIVTESGLVVIPVACNATLHNVDSGFTPMTSGFLAAYGKEWKIPLDWNIDESFMNTFFIKNTETNEWDIRNRTINGMEIALAELSYSDSTVNQALIDWYLYDMAHGQLMDKTNSLNILHEVMRGAPIENIDFDLENLNLNRTVDKSGLIAAAKLDSIINSLNWDEDNSIMSIPNLSFIDNYQYVIVIIFKILLIIIIVALMVTVYIDVMKATISGRTILKCVGILVLGVSSVLLIPVSYDLAYYQSNKALLQDEAEYILMLNTEKKMSGREIGISSVSEPKANTQIMLKLEDISFNWIECLPDVVFGDSIDVLDKKYKEYLNTSLICKEDLVQPMNDGIYVDVQDIFDTTSVIFNPDTKMLSQNVKIDPSLSYYLPYYYFLDALILNVNKFNYNNNIYAYSTKIMRGGKVGTINLVSTYFNSEWFETSTDADFLGLYQLYDVMGDMYVEDVFAEDNIEKARSSQWFVGTMMKEEERLKRCEIMNTKVREFVASHRNLIGKVTDETFLKCMAMSLSLKYNDLFGIPSASAYEVYNLSNTDLMRLTVCDKATTLEDSPMSFARFVYNEAGTPGVYASVFLVIVTMFVQTMKTIITIAIMALLIVSVFVFKILLRKQSSSIAGYFLTLLVICGTNILYAFILKASLAIPQTGLAPTLCIIIQIIIQLAYLALLGIVLSFALRDWKNAGFTFYQQIGSNIKTKISNAFHKKNQTPQERYDSKPRGKDGWDYYRKLVSDNEKRIKKVGNH